MIYFKDVARELGADVDNMSDLAVWNVILRHQGKPELIPGEITHPFQTKEHKMEWT